MGPLCCPRPHVRLPCFGISDLNVHRKPELRNLIQRPQNISTEPKKVEKCCYVISQVVWSTSNVVQPVQTGLVERIAEVLLGFLRLRRLLRFWGRPKFSAGKMRPFRLP